MLVLEAQGMDVADTALETSSCGMPVAFQVERLRRELSDRFGNAFSILSTDLAGLEGAELTEVTDAIVACEPSPFVLVNGRLVCKGIVDVGAVLESLA